jgi:hypothetical protein
MRNSKPRPDWVTRFAIAGALSGFLFMAVFVRMPHWMNWGVGEVLTGALAMGFVFGGGFAGAKFYMRYGCSHLGLHIWEHHTMDAGRRCVNCDRFFRPVHGPADKLLGWEEGRYSRDETAQRIVWGPVNR